ncbi:MAG TPA: serine hydrolase domain-containing protein, partial [Longimicrobiaceae bacterium]|nr:serine hydrolase domain-containing protein [Longimicrobiaceae bacterium]
MRRISILVSLLLSLCLPLHAQTGEHAHSQPAGGSGQPAAQGAEPQDTLAARVDALFRQWDRPGSPGAAVAVIRDGEIVYSRGYGMANLEYDVPITPTTIFHIASVSKHFTAFAIALLAEEGKLSLDDDIRTHLPEVPDFGRTLTIRHLIHHTSGLRDQWELLAMAGWRLDDVITREHILKMVSHQRALNFDPGEEYLYSNTGYTLMALLVERVSGQSFREFTEERIFRPLGMTSTHFHDDHEMIVPGRAYSYAPRPGGGFRNSPLNYANVGATSLFTTVEDLAKWDRNFYEPQVGSEALFAQMESRGVLNDGRQIEYAFALSIGEHHGLRTVGHSGADAGYRSYYVRFPEQRLSVVVLSNLSSFNPTRVALRVADIYLAGHFPDRRRSQAYAAPETDALRGHGAQRQPAGRGEAAAETPRTVQLNAQQLREK